MPAKKTLLFCLGLILSGFSYQALHAQSADGIYTADQAKRGEALFKKQCSSCHGEALDGVGPYPALSGDEFLSKYEGQPTVTLYDMIQKLMPATAPGSLSRPEAADLLAYILSFNKFPAGKTELPSDEDSLKKLILPKPAPKT
ncbi:MAG TPA: cytochrome c [Acidobacteriaceae bacterium]|nr:cytochrome c [Acidobacteriaceae bacterium]